MFARILLIVSAVLFAAVNGQTNSTSSSSTGSSGTVTCGGAGYDLSSLSNLDIFIITNTTTDVWMYTVHPCGTTSASLNACDGMVCQNATTLATYDPALVDWVAIDNGVEMMVQDGEGCGGNGPRAAYISFICDATATTPNFVSMSETTTCHYTGVIQTSAVCTPTGTTGPSGVGSEFFSSTCGGGAYDFSRLNSNDITGHFGDYNWTVRVCGTVANSDCSSVQPTSICQSQDSNAYSLNNWSAIGGRALYKVGANDINMTMADGENCGDVGNRSTLVQFSCNASATVPVMVNAFEQYTCNYVIQIQTADVCGTPFSSNGTVGSSSSSGVFVNTSSSSSSGMVDSSSSSSSGILVNSSSSSSSSPVVDSSSSTGTSFSSSSSAPMSSTGDASSSSSVDASSSSSVDASSSSSVDASSSSSVDASSSSSSSSFDSSSSGDVQSTGVVVDSSSSSPIVEDPQPGGLNGASSMSIALAVFVALMSVLASL